MTGTASRTRAIEAAAPTDAVAHFRGRLSYETDCSDVHHDLAVGVPGVVVIDARSAELFAVGHVPGAWSLPHRTITAETTAGLPRDALLVTYCAGPHCNAATQAAARLADLGFHVKEMLGGYDYWCREGYAVEHGDIVNKRETSRASWSGYPA